MRKTVLLGSLLLLVPLAGCRGDDYSAVMRDAAQELARVYSSCSRAGFGSPTGQLKKDLEVEQEKLKAIKERMDRLPPLSAAAKARNYEKYYVAMNSLVRRVEQISQRFQNQPALTSIVEMARTSFVPQKE